MVYRLSSCVKLSSTISKRSVIVVGFKVDRASPSNDTLVRK
jgi:hypothetical protein